MGNTKLRRLLKQEEKWTDPTAPKHKHRFDIHALMQLRNTNNSISCYNVMRCRYCNSFKSISREGSHNGYISDINSIDTSLPRICLYTTHPNLIGFSTAVLDPLVYGG